MKLLRIVCVILSASILTACSGAKGNNETSPSGPYVYYLNTTATTLVPENVSLFDDDWKSYLDALCNNPSNSELKAPLSDISILNSNLDATGKLTLDFGREYQAIDKYSEILIRAAVVKTLIQYKGIDSVEFLVSGEPIVDSGGNIIGSMDATKFVDYFAGEQESLIYDNFTIYYATLDGNSLVSETHRDFFENSLSYEQAVIRCMLESPDGNDCKVAVSPNINIINITTTDGVCYLDMDMGFYDESIDVDVRVALMSIVNSLCELDSIRKVNVNIISTQSEPGSDNLFESLSGTYERDINFTIE